MIKIKKLTLLFSLGVIGSLLSLGISIFTQIQNERKKAKLSDFVLPLPAVQEHSFTLEEKN